MEASKAENSKMDSFNTQDCPRLDQTIVQINLCTKVQVFYKTTPLLQTVISIENR